MIYVFFFFKQKTAYEMRISDWSSDVCSSDLLAGTGSDHQLTKWSAKACEQHTGMGKPRAKVAIDELIQHGFVARTERSTKLYPQYRLPPIPLDSDPIFLPVALVTGIEADAYMLRRVRETGESMMSRMIAEIGKSSCRVKIFELG